jgi:ATP-binding cassette subfamily B protein
MSDTLPPAGPLWRSLRKLEPHLEGRRLGLIAVVALAVSTASIAAFEPLVLKAVFDSFLTGRALSSAFMPFALLIGISLARDGLALVQDRLFWKARLAINFSLLRATVDRLHSLPLSYHRDQSVGATMTKIERGIAGAISAFTEVLLQLFPALVYLSVSVVVMFQIDARLAGAVLAFAPLPAAVGAFAAREQATRERNLMQRWTRLFARFNEVLTGIVGVNSF